MRTMCRCLRLSDTENETKTLPSLQMPMQMDRETHKDGEEEVETARKLEVAQVAETMNPVKSK